jgi:plastocyanin
MIVALLAGLGLGACGDDDDDDGDVATEEGGGAAAMTIVGFAFDPAELAISSGDTIEVTNEDDTRHTFTSEDAGFDEELDGGSSASVTVTAEPGTYDFMCRIHTNMKGTITVV